MSRQDDVRVGVIGLGAWGKNLLREFYYGPNSVVPIASDTDAAARSRAGDQYDGLEVTADPNDVLNADVDAVIVATPPDTHFALASKAIRNGKDVFVEKPLVLDVEEGKRLTVEARSAGRILMVGHIMMYHPAVDWLKKHVEDDGLGPVYYLYATRTNLGRVREIENAMWSFAPHDISMMSYILGAQPQRVAAVGQSYLRAGIEDVAFLTLWYSENRMAHIHTSWLDPHKVRSLTIVGQKRMAVFSDTSPTQRITIFDKGVDREFDYNTYAEYLTLRTGEAHIPQIDNTQPLALECQHFIDRVRDRKTPRSDGRNGVEVLQVLASAQESLKSGGVPVDIPPLEESV
ncbi:MAG: Gfo/Idh/MocA family oxidoreductase [Candidatus Zixiibacteriota bacterium]